MELEHVQIKGLPPSKRVFRAGNTYACVDIKRTRDQSHEDFLIIKVCVCQVDENGEPVTHPGGGVVSCESKNIPISKSALAEGQETIHNIMAEQTAQAVARLRNHRAAIDAWAWIPAEEPAGEGE